MVKMIKKRLTGAKLEGEYKVADMLPDGERYIVGDKLYYQDIVSKRVAILNDNLRREELNEIERVAHFAWVNKDYDKIIKIYNNLDNLNNIQKKKLAIAIRKKNKLPNL